MNHDRVTNLLHELNHKYFYDCLIIDDSSSNFWTISVVDTYDSLQFWINTKRNFEIRHSEATQFMWWVDFLISDEISAQFDGRIVGDTSFKSYDTPHAFREYVQKYTQRKIKPLGSVGWFKNYVVSKFLYWDCSKKYLKESKKDRNKIQAKISQQK